MLKRPLGTTAFRTEAVNALQRDVKLEQYRFSFRRR